MPKVSIIIPTYKRTPLLDLTLRSIQQQTFKDFEVIVVDDGSPGEENERLCAVFDKVKYLKIENSGSPAKPRNIGIKQATGMYLAFLDDDDLWLPNKLEEQVETLNQNPDFGLVHGCCELIDKDGNLLNKIVGRPGKPSVKHGDVKLRMMGNWTVMMPTSFVKKEVVDRVGYFNEDMPAAGEDAEFWIRCSFFTNFYYIDKPLVYYRIHPNNISKKAKGYVNLPLYLKNILIEYRYKKIINNNQYKILLNNLCSMQLKMIKSYRSNSLINLFKLKPFWMFYYQNLKLLCFILIKR